MEQINQQQQNELKKVGVLNREGGLNPKLNKADLENLIKGGGLIVEKNSKTFKMTFNKEGKLDIKQTQGEKLKHMSLSSAELMHLSNKENKKGILHKNFSNHGVIKDYGRMNFMGNRDNEKQFFLKINREGKDITFFGNDLEKSLDKFKIGDNVQVNYIGSKKGVFEINGKGEIEKFDNLFSIEKFDSRKANVKESLFKYDSKEGKLIEVETTNLNIKSINGREVNAKELERLKKGKSIEDEEGNTFRIIPEKGGELRIKSNIKKLAVLSIMLDGGLSFAIISAIRGVKDLNDWNNNRLVQKDYKMALEKVKESLEKVEGKGNEIIEIKKNIGEIEKELKGEIKGGNVIENYNLKEIEVLKEEIKSELQKDPNNKDLKIELNEINSIINRTNVSSKKEGKKEIKKPIVKKVLNLGKDIKVNDLLVNRDRGVDNQLMKKESKRKIGL